MLKLPIMHDSLEPNEDWTFYSLMFCSYINKITKAVTVADFY